MKQLLLLLTLFGSVEFTSAQCTINFTADTLETCDGVPVTINSFLNGNFGNYNTAVCDFNNGLPPSWTTSGATTFTQPCLPSLDFSPYFWASTSGTNTPSVTSEQFDFTYGGTISFDMVYSVQSGASPCEGPDEADEGISIQYSIDMGATWVDIAYMSPGGYILPTNPLTSNIVASGQTPYTDWNTYTLNIPPGAQTPNTMVRWIQLFSSGTCCDNWGIDNVSLLAVNSIYTLQWSTGATNTNSIEVTTSVDSTFYLQLIDTGGVLICEDSCFVQIVNNSMDLGVQLIGQSFVPNLYSYLFVDAYNVGCPTQSGTVTVTLDPVLDFISSSPPPTTINGNVLTYNISGLYMNGPHDVTHMLVKTDPLAPLGYPVQITATIDPTIGDVQLYNNTYVLNDNVLASYDPNDKKVYPLGECSVGYVPNSEKMTYTVRFQNTGSYYATDVYVRDTLDANLNPATLKVAAASHPYYLNWLSPTVVDFTFDSIMLPPQSWDEMESNGYVVFEIDQDQPLAHGTPFTNKVDIYFDFNAPITTNTVLNTVTDGSHHVIGDTAFLTVQDEYIWGADTLNSSGVYQQIFSTVEGCDSTAWLSLTIDDSGIEHLVFDHFRVYPNPTNGLLYVSGNQSAEMRLLDPTGAVVLIKSIDKEAVIDLQHLAPGVYLLELTANDTVYQGRIAKQ